MFSRIVIGLLIMILGGALIYFSANLVETFGRVNWAEEKVGGTRQLRVLIGFGGVVIGGLVMMGVLGFANPTDMKTTGF